MDDFTYICTACFRGFDQNFNDRGIRPTKCPKCGSYEVLPADEFRENERINAQEAEAESWLEL